MQEHLIPKQPHVHRRCKLVDEHVRWRDGDGGAEAIQLHCDQHQHAVLRSGAQGQTTALWGTQVDPVTPAVGAHDSAGHTFDGKAEHSIDAVVGVSTVGRVQSPTRHGAADAAAHAAAHAAAAARAAACTFGTRPACRTGADTRDQQRSRRWRRTRVRG